MSQSPKLLFFGGRGDVGGGDRAVEVGMWGGDEEHRMRRGEAGPLALGCCCPGHWEGGVDRSKESEQLHVLWREQL